MILLLSFQEGFILLYSSVLHLNCFLCRNQVFSCKRHEENVIVNHNSSNQHNKSYRLKQV